MKGNDQNALVEAIDSLRAEIVRLTERVTILEGKGLEGRGGAAPAGAETPPQLGPGVTEELVAVLSAAIAAYLGVKPRIKQIRLLEGASWAQQGRVTIQASHILPVRHG